MPVRPLTFRKKEADPVEEIKVISKKKLEALKEDAAALEAKREKRREYNRQYRARKKAEREAAKQSNN
jgi:Skp family chaperone for outer membrane proteins